MVDPLESEKMRLTALCWKQAHVQGARRRMEESDREDLAQEACRRVAPRLERLLAEEKAEKDEKGSSDRLARYVHRVVRNLLEDRARREARHRLDLVDDLDRFVVETDDPAKDFLIERIERELARLTDEDRRTVMLVGEFGTSGAAFALGLNEAAVRKRLSRARKVLQGGPPQEAKDDRQTRKG